MPRHPADPSPELVRMLCARAGPGLSDDDLTAVVDVLIAHQEAMTRLRGLEPVGEVGAFDPTWR